MKALPVLLCIDVEPNDRQVAGDPATDWSATPPCLEMLDRFRTSVQQSTGNPVHLNWFLRLDPQIAEAYGSAAYACSRYATQWRDYRAAGDEIGLHVHAWRRSGRTWTTDHADPEWVRHCAAIGIDSYREHFLETPRSFRFGDRFLNSEVVDLLEREGVSHDLTLEPGHPAQELTWDRATGLLPDCRHMPRTPYQPCPFNHLQRGSLRHRRLWMVPVSTGRPRWFRRTRHLNLGVRPDDMRRVFDNLVANATTTHISWVARTGDFANPTCRSNFFASLAFLMEHPRRSAFRFVRPDELISTAHEHFSQGDRLLDMQACGRRLRLRRGGLLSPARRIPNTDR